MILLTDLYYEWFNNKVVATTCKRCKKKIPANNYLFKINNRNNRQMSKICSKIRIKTPERRCSDVFIVNFEHIWRLFLVFAFMISSMCLFAMVHSFLRSKNRNVRKNPVFLCILHCDIQKSPLTVVKNLGKSEFRNSGFR